MATKINKTKKIIDYYLNLPWTYTIETTKETGTLLYIICVNELPGICTDASSLEEGMTLIKEVMKAAFELYLQQGNEIPEPIDESKYKGNIAYRTTSKRHYLIAREAKKRDLSLNRIIDECIDSVFKKRKL